ncbi:XRE family transcriptional regulator [Brevibacterium limosum]|uniref:XRE family transcriptional regulator n=1 Tax=Brevibacterium limosum TaxID=2697565 RepID=UPI001AA142D7|nr:XRE family transcriptional regulator [Brevibacterium limosum]
MSTEEIIIDGPLARATRALCQVAAKHVADKAEIGKSELKDYEKGITDLTAEQERRLVLALEQYGARFIPDGKEGGYGIRLKFSRAKVRAIERWEDEGGTPGADDV